MSCYQVLILHFRIVACIRALRDKPHAFNYWVKGGECIWLKLNDRESNGRCFDITYCLFLLFYLLIILYYIILFIYLLIKHTPLHQA